MLFSHRISFTLLLFSSFCFQSTVYGQSDTIRIRIMPAYDQMANAGISPHMIQYLTEALEGEQAIRVIPFTARQSATLPIQMVYDKKYIMGTEIETGIDVVVMSKLDVVEIMPKTEAMRWNLTLRFYHVHAAVQEEFVNTYKNRTANQIQSEIHNDAGFIRQELKKIYAKHMAGKGYDQLTDADDKGRYTVSDYNTDLAAVPNIRRPEKSEVIDPAFNTDLLWQIWTLDNEGPHADFWWRKEEFFIVDYDGNGAMPYRLEKDSLTVYYNDFVKKGLVKGVTKDSLFIHWEGANEAARYARWTN